MLSYRDELLRPGDGFLLLDLHNVYCQMCNFSLSAAELLASYPLARVWELHVSGGSWSTSQHDSTAAPVRRDTHDGAVPNEVFALVTLALQRCPQVKAVILERLGNTMHEPFDREQFAADFYRLHEVVETNVCATVAEVAPTP